MVRLSSLPAWKVLLLLAVPSVLLTTMCSAQPCSSVGIWVQVLGSGGPELQDKRASSSYLVWDNGTPRVLVDAGGGSALRFGESGAQMSQLDVILFTHYHVDHSGDFPALIKSSWFEDRSRPLPIYGPPGNNLMPSTTEFVGDLFGARGAWRYLSELLVPGEGGSYHLQPHNVIAASEPKPVLHSGHLSITAVRVVHGPFPAIAWRVELGGKSVAFTGDTNGDGVGLVRLARDADLLIAHNAVPGGATGVERNLHMPPSVIGILSSQARVKHLVLSHRMLRTLGKEEQTRAEIVKHYSGPLDFANDLDCYEAK